VSLRLIPALFALILLAVTPATPQAKAPEPQQGGQLDASITIFTVLAALHAGGFDWEIDSASSHPLRQAIRDHLADQDLAIIRALKTFVGEHRQRDPMREFGQYLSYALLIDGPPNFAYRVPVAALPPEAAELVGLNSLLATFYREANVGELWKTAQPYFNQSIAQLHEPVSRAVLQANAYLRNPTSGSLGRRSQIYVDLLGPPNQVQTRSYLDDYFVVVTPAGDVPIDDIQHAYLHYLLDPMVLKYSAMLKEKHALGDFALGSPILDDQYKSDFILLSTECLIKAVESRLQRKPALVTQALREGFILTPVFAEQLAEYEKQDRSFRLHLPEMIDAIDLKREDKRLENVQFTSDRPVRSIRVERVEKPAELSAVEKQFEAAEAAYTGRNLTAAKDLYLRLLQGPDEKSIHAKSYYGLARIAVLERDPELADRLFRKVLELGPDASTKSWSLLYLARLADSQGDREQAQEHYKAALAVEGAPDSVRQAAEKGLKEAFSKK
jgi:tetratricopeptide (TPR) repeat protein